MTVPTFEEGDTIICIAQGRPELGRSFTVTQGNYDALYGGPMIKTNEHPTGIYAGYFEHEGAESPVNVSGNADDPTARRADTPSQAGSPEWRHYDRLRHPKYPTGVAIMLGDRVKLRNNPQSAEYIVTGIKEPSWYSVNEVWIQLRGATNQMHRRGALPEELVLVGV